MDGIHDLGGKQGYGPIEVGDDDRPFHSEWEGREWGIAQCARAPGITIDWWRHCRELIMPLDYLERPYFDSWAQTDFATYIEAGWMTLAEAAAGKAPAAPDSTDPPQYARGRNATIHAYNGAHVFPDLSAQGTEIHQHCYNVVFVAADLWPEAAGSKDQVYLDLWESYLSGA